MSQKNRNIESSVDEVTPLLAASAGNPVAQPNKDPAAPEASAMKKDDDDKPLPMTQIILLCYARVVEPIAFFSIFPFINQMIWETGNLDQTDVGFYSGLIESLFSLTQMFVMILWGRAADRLGRKPVLVFSMVGVSIATALFGFSKTIWQMIIFRCIAGVFGGSIVTIRTMITEHSTPKTQARAFSFFAFSGNLGIFIGPLLGGSLSNPATQIPSVFGNVQLFKDYPYALATIVSGAVGASAAILSALFVNETLDRKVDGKSNRDESMSTWEIIKAPGVTIVLFIYGHTMLLAFAYTAVAPVFYFTPVQDGGYGFSPFLISIFIALAGFSQAIWVLGAFPPLQHRFGTGGVLRACAIAWPIFFLSAPLGNIFLKRKLDAAFWTVLPVATALGAGVSMAFTCVQLALNDISPSPGTLGTLNGIALTLVSGIRAFAPALFASVFAQGARTQFLSGYLIWLVMAFLALLLLVALRWLPLKAEGRLKPDKHAPEGDERVVR